MQVINLAAKWGLLLGVIMSISRIWEADAALSGDPTKFALLTFEWVGVVALYTYLLYRANRARAELNSPEMGYKARDVFNFSMLISLFAAVIVGISFYIYVERVVGGYDLYIIESVESIRGVIAQMDISSELSSSYEKGIEGMHSAVDSDVSIFSAVISMAANYIIGGFISSLIFLKFVTRKAITPHNGE